MVQRFPELVERTQSLCYPSVFFDVFPIVGINANVKSFPSLLEGADVIGIYTERVSLTRNSVAWSDESKCGTGMPVDGRIERIAIGNRNTGEGMEVHADRMADIGQFYRRSQALLLVNFEGKVNVLLEHGPFSAKGFPHDPALVFYLRQSVTHGPPLLFGILGVTNVGNCDDNGGGSHPKSRLRKAIRPSSTGPRPERMKGFGYILGGVVCFFLGALCFAGSGDAMRQRWYFGIAAIIVGGLLIIVFVQLVSHGNQLLDPRLQPDFTEPLSYRSDRII